MSKMKRVVAIALAAVMTMGSTLTVFAADTTGSGETHGTGENEGHVDKEVINVVLPTVPATGSPFDYVTDPERLIQATAGARYEDYTFPESTSDTGVYFRVGEKQFDNKSETLQVINKSSCDVTVTVKVKATKVGDNDLALATSSTTATATPLYLNLKVGATDQVISDTEATVAKTIAGNASNFAVQYTGNGYEYVPKADAYQWKALGLTLNGAVDTTAVVTGETTAPTVDVTWSYAKADGTSPDTGDQTDYEETGEAEIVSISDYIKADPKDIVIKFSLGKGPDAVDADGLTMTQGASKTAVAATNYTLDMANKTVTIKAAAGWVKSATADIPVYITLTKGGAKVKELTGKIAVKNDYDPAAPEIISISDYNKTDQNDVVITFSLGFGSLAVDADGLTMTQGPSKTAVPAANYTLDMANKTVTIKGAVSWMKSATNNYPIYITLTKGGSAVTELSGTITVK